MLHDAMFYEKVNGRIRCILCPHNCLLGDGQFGLCSVRTNINGILKTINYGEVASISVDPIEKKPLYHYKPSKRILSVGSFGCNFSCGFCQNYSISQYRPETDYISPKRLVDEANEIYDNIGIAYTYNEPSIWYEYVFDCCKLLKSRHKHLKNILVTNGYIEHMPLKELLPYVDAMNIDLKAYSQDFYRKVCSGTLDEVLKTIELAAKNCHVEITTLLIDSLNDSAEEVEQIALFISRLDKNIPLHLSRCFPAYNMNRQPTDLGTMKECAVAAGKHLNFVFLGNVTDIDNSTYCPKCKKLLIDRRGYSITVHIDSNKCPECGESISVIL